MKGIIINNMAATCQYYIKEYLKKHGKSPGGDLERYIGGFTKYKPSTIARTMRIMAKDNKLAVSYNKINRGPKFVVYDLNGLIFKGDIC